MSASPLDDATEDCHRTRDKPLHLKNLKYFWIISQYYLEEKHFLFGHSPSARPIHCLNVCATKQQGCHDFYQKYIRKLKG